MGGIKYTRGQHVEYMPSLSSLMMVEKKPPQQGGVNEVKQGGGMWVIHHPVVFKRIPPINGGVNK